MYDAVDMIKMCIKNNVTDNNIRYKKKKKKKKKTSC